MKFGNAYKFCVCLLIVFSISISVFTYKQLFQSKNIILSPLPNFLTTFANNQVTTLSLWLPVSEIFKPNNLIQAPKITAKSALIYDLTSSKVLFSKNPNKKLPMASLTKIMTAIIALESPRKNEYEVLQKDLVGENSMGLSVGEVLNLEELLYGLILSSGNDAAETLASNFERGREEFIAAMNNKAESLGLKNTHFTNPTGLEGNGKQYSTAYDLLIITKYALRSPLFKRVAGTFIYSIPYSENHKQFYLENETNLLTSYPGVFGVKDGYTPEAGLCLVTYLSFEGHEIIGILLGSDNRRDEMKELLDYGLKIQGITPPSHS
ncbi:MAG: hypothetical protein A3H79_00315 [Candidatus Levybacteria bacterium RIFCSPLOWO2_02_FULL_36_8b]|nr:MAG: hypothetical protein A3H79_00315 [Candidatus Levybacteria bacterium RIFCSPLOWO2_02_FULL_36_8b]